MCMQRFDNFNKMLTAFYSTESSSAITSDYFVVEEVGGRKVVKNGFSGCLGWMSWE